MKVLHVIPSLSLKHGGPSVALPAIAEALVGQGIQVTIATTDDNGPGHHLEIPLGTAVARPSGAQCYYFRKNSEFYKISWALRGWLRAHISEFDLVHIHALFSFTSIAAGRIAWRQKVPYVVRPLGVLNRWGMENRRRWLKRLSLHIFELPVLRRAASIHFTSRAERAEAINTDPTIGEMPFAIIPLPVGSDVEKVERALFFDRFPQARGRNVILFLSRIDVKKGLELLLDAFKTIRAGHAGVILVIAGDGEAGYLRSLRDRATALGIENDIIWAGFLGGEQKTAAFRAATIFVLPSYSENFGIAAAEALAHGVPSVISNGVALAEDLEEAEAAIVVTCDATALATGICRLLDEPETRGRLAGNAQKLAREKYSSDAVGRALVALYHSAVQQAAERS